jgi:hypothetical protein
LGSCLSNDLVDSGTLSLRVIDAPVDRATKVVVQFIGVDLHSIDGTESLTFAQPKVVDLMAYGGRSSYYLLENEPLVSGIYDWIRLRLDASGHYIALDDGSVHDLLLANVDDPGLKLNATLTVPVDDEADYVVDFDLRKSVVAVADGYALKPTLRIVEASAAGAAGGRVHPDLMASAACGEGAAVYAYAGRDATPMDVARADSDPLTTAPVRPVSLGRNENGEEFYAWAYMIGFLPAADYTIALTCDAERDDPDQSDAMSWIAQTNVTVPAEQQALHDFLAQ